MTLRFTLVFLLKYIFCFNFVDKWYLKSITEEPNKPFFYLRRKNITSLDINFQDLSYDRIKQTPVFETWNLLGTLP